MASRHEELLKQIVARSAAWALCAISVTSAVLATSAAWAAGTLIVGMTAGDIPVVTGNPDQGFEGYRFVGYNLYDALLL